jgi:hypothetical protein
MFVSVLDTIKFIENIKRFIVDIVLVDSLVALLNLFCVTRIRIFSKKKSLSAVCPYVWSDL